MLHYAVPPAVLAPWLPPGCELVVEDDSAFVGLVGLNFTNTVVRGISWPGYRHFPEVNLRFYVHRGDRRGVVFVRELVPLRAVAWLARLAYNEPYHRVPLTSRREQAAGVVTVGYDLTFAGHRFGFAVVADARAAFPDPASDDFRFTDQHWGFGTTRRQRLLSYRVDHPVWTTHPVRSWNLNWDWERIYGPAWRFLQAQSPRSVTLATGSDVQVAPWAGGE